MHSLLAADGVDATFARKAQAVLDDLAGHGYRVKVTEVLRSKSKQRAYFASGRSDAQLKNRGFTVGEIKTYRAQGYLASGERITTILSSMHTKGLAMDIVFIVNNVAIWDTKYEGWHAYGSSCAAHKLTWGGTWKSFKDYAHCELGK